MPFLLAHGYTQTETGTVLGGAGLLATILGTLAGGMAVANLPLRVALVSFGVLQASAGLLFWDLSGRGHDLGWMTAAVVSENFFVGMGTSALVAWLLGICQPRYAATQFALLSSLMAFGRDLLTAPAGYVAQSTGWPAFFLWTVVACLPGLVLVGPATRKGGGSALP
jgi:PAT family beta-lactamase induction signal transducer AmpG